MQIKDYYKTLEIQPVATPLQIKKSFRQLALKHHPDKNPGNAIAEARFREIQEAYEVLSDPGKREEYNYKRWYNRSINEAFVNELLTPTAILNECIKLVNHLQAVNAMRIDFDGLSYHIRQLLNNKNISILLQANDQLINMKIIEAILQPASLLPLKYTGPITDLLLRIAGNHETAIDCIAAFIAEQKQKHQWQKYKLVLVIGITLLLCGVIYWVSK